MDDGLRYALLSATTIVCVTASAPAIAQVKSFNIPAQDAASGIAALGRQADVQIAASRRDTRGKRTNAVNGSMSIERALDTLLVGTGLTARATGVQTYTVVPFSEESERGTQTAGTGEEDAAIDQDIVVTASSRLKRSDVPTPTVVADLQLLAEGARDNAVAALNDLPQFKPSSQPTVNPGSVFGAGTYAPDLRGLGTRRTLTLLDRRRIASSYVNPDYSTIPNILVKRVEVVTSSASAAWGSGAVAGVVNIVLDEDFEGLKLGAQSGISGQGDVGQKMFEGAWGTSFADGKGHVVVAAEYDDFDGTTSRSSARPNVGRWGVVSNPAYTATNGQSRFILAPDTGFADASLGGLITSGVNKGMTFNPDGTLRLFNVGRVDGLTSIGGEAPANDDVTPLIAPNARYTLFGRATYEVSDALKLTGEVRYADLWSNNPLFPDASRAGGAVTVAIDNAFLPVAVRNQMLAAGETSFTLGRFNTDFAAIGIDYDRKVYQATLALDGRISDHLTWSAYYSHGEFRQHIALTNERLKANLANAVDSVISPTTGQPVCRIALTDPSTSCVPIDLFGYGAPSQAARDYVLADSTSFTKTKLDAGALTLSGEGFDLWAGPVSFALGIEARRETVGQTVGALDAAAAFAFYNAPVYSGANTTKEAFGEVLVPLVRDLPLLQKLEFNGAARVTHDVTGTIWSWKLGATDELVDGVSLRFARSRDIRSPSLDELFAAPLGPGNTPINDPQTNQTYFVQTFTGGNRALKPEVSSTLTAGATLAPRFLPDLQLSVDYFDIDIANAISTISAQNAVNACYNGNAGACAGITRGSSGLVTVVRANQLNFVNLQARGFDIELLYTLPLGAEDSLRLRSNVTWNTRFSTDDGLSQINYLRSVGDVRQFGVPAVYANTSITYDSPRFGANLRGRFLSAGLYDRNRDIENNRIPPFFYLDAGVRATVKTAGSRSFDFYININNLLDKAPPPGAQFTPYYDVVGRYFVAGAKVRF